METRQKRRPRQPLRAGAMTILATAAVLCLAVLSVLALTTARADLAMAERQRALVETQAEAERIGQAWLADVDAYRQGLAALPEGTTADGTVLTAGLPVGGSSTLEVAVNRETMQLTRWQLTTAWNPTTGDALWPG